VAEIFQLVCNLRQRGISILLAEQNARSALAIADRGYVIENGRVTLVGPARDPSPRWGSPRGSRQRRATRSEGASAR